jgi:glutaminyl-tRNA synthetase
LRIEPALSEAKVGDVVQFECNGYFCTDPDTMPGKPVFNRTIGLRDTYAKDMAKEKTAGEGVFLVTASY